MDFCFCNLVAYHLLGFLEWFIIEEENVIKLLGFKNGRLSKWLVDVKINISRRKGGAGTSRSGGAGFGVKLEARVINY